MMKTLGLTEAPGLYPCASTSGISFLDTGLWTTSWTPWSAADGPSSSSQRILSSLTGAATSSTSPTSGFSMGMLAEKRPSWSCWSRCPRTTSPNAFANCANSWAPPPTWSGLRKRRRLGSSGEVSATLWAEKRMTTERERKSDEESEQRKKIKKEDKRRKRGKEMDKRDNKGWEQSQKKEKRWDEQQDKNFKT